MKKLRRLFSVLMIICASAFVLSLEGLAAAVPERPSGLAAENVKRSSLTLVWNKSRYADFYRVYISENGEWKTLDDTTERSYKISGLHPSKSYTFAVRSVNEAGNKDYFSKKYATVKVKTKDLAKVKVRAVSGVNYVTLKWSKTSYATGYNIYRKTDGKWKLVKKLPADARSYTVKELKSDRAYQFSVRARDTVDGKAVLSPHSSVKISTMRPNKVKLSVVSATDSRVRLKWTKAQDATGYRVYRYSGGKWNTVKTISSGDKLSAVITSLKSDSRHKFRVRAFCEYEDRTVWFTPSASKTAVTEPGKKDLKVYRTDKLRDTLSGSFTLSYQTENKSHGTIETTISKSGEKYYLYSNLNYNDYELINIKDGDYIILRQKKVFVKAPKMMAEALDIGAAVKALLPSGSMKAKASLESFEGKETVCETYSNASGSKKISYYYRTGELVGIEEYSSGQLVERAVISELTDTALKGVFKVPSGYKELSYL